MRKRRFAYLALALLLPAGGFYAFRALGTPDWSRHPLLGVWVGEPLPSGMVMPHSLSFSADGTGRESSGLGTFDCRWRPLARRGAAVRVRITHAEGSYWAGEPRELDVELVGPDMVKIGGRVYSRLK